MSESADLKLVVKRILRTNGPQLQEFIKADLVKIAHHLHAKGLIERTAVDRMSLTGVDRFQLASDLMDACQPLLVTYPERNFPKFIAVMKEFVTMEQLAERMEDEFKEASMSFPKRLAHKWLYHKYGSNYIPKLWVGSLG